MAKTLDVYLNKQLTGHLNQNDEGHIVFQYEKKYLSVSNALALSHSLPLRAETFSPKECQGFFSGILPEDENRRIIARNLGISANNYFAMLAKIGGECAGAVMFMPANSALPEANYDYHFLSNEELAHILEILPLRPLMAGEEGVRLSLAGAQDKLAVYIENGQMALPLDSAPSTHILKPQVARFEGLVFNEAFCINLAQAIGLPAVKLKINRVKEFDYLLIERYDRVKNVRLHQEDFCQALGIVSERKYQSEGGPSLKICFDLLRNLSTLPLVDLRRLLDSVIFNYLIGNHDAHGKNFSIIYNDQEGYSARLAPLYDAVCTVHYPELTKKMAMKIGGEYESGKILPKHFEKLAEDAQLAKPFVKHRVLQMANAIISEINKNLITNPTQEAIAKLIKSRCERVLINFT